MDIIGSEAIRTDPAASACSRRIRALGAAGSARNAHRSPTGGSARRCCGRRRCGAHDGRCCTVRASRVGCVAGQIVSSRVYRRGHCRSSDSSYAERPTSTSRASSSDADACPHQPGGLPDRVQLALDADPARIRVFHRTCPCPRSTASAGRAGRHPGGVLSSSSASTSRAAATTRRSRSTTGPARRSISLPADTRSGCTSTAVRSMPWHSRLRWMVMLPVATCLSSRRQARPRRSLHRRIRRTDRAGSTETTRWSSARDRPSSTSSVRSESTPEVSGERVWPARPTTPFAARPGSRRATRSEMTPSPPRLNGTGSRQTRSRNSVVTA